MTGEHLGLIDLPRNRTLFPEPSDWDRQHCMMEMPFS
jgi:hypothetical protein